jgi:ATP-dependent Clp endopeptidase proteolytic subunit ClpP
MSAVEIAICDEIGFGGITAAAFRDILQAAEGAKEINLRISSPGGDVFDGIAIYNMLARHPAKVTVTVDGVAASIASLIAMVGQQIRMPGNAMMMVHNPAGLVLGEAIDLREMADALDKMKAAMVATYAKKTGLKADELGRLLDAETWMTAAEAKAKGFADVVLPPVAATAKARAFDLSRFANAPPALKANVDWDEIVAGLNAERRAARPGAGPATLPPPDPASAALWDRVRARI